LDWRRGREEKFHTPTMTGDWTNYQRGGGGEGVSSVGWGLEDRRRISDGGCSGGEGKEEWIAGCAPDWSGLPTTKI